MARQPTFAVHISLTVSLKNVYSDFAERLLQFILIGMISGIVFIIFPPMPRLWPTTFCIPLKQRVALPNPIWIGLEKFVSKFSTMDPLPRMFIMAFHTPPAPVVLVLWPMP